MPTKNPTDGGVEGTESFYGGLGGSGTAIDSHHMISASNPVQPRAKMVPSAVRAYQRGGFVIYYNLDSRICPPSSIGQSVRLLWIPDSQDLLI